MLFEDVDGAARVVRATLDRRELWVLRAALRELLRSWMADERESRTLLGSSRAQIEGLLHEIEAQEARLAGRRQRAEPDPQRWALNAIQRAMDEWSMLPQWRPDGPDQRTFRELFLVFSRGRYRFQYNPRFPELGDVIPILELVEEEEGSPWLVLGFWIRLLGDEIFPPREQWHVAVDLRDVLPARRRELTELLDLASGAADASRFTGLLSILEDEVLPIMIKGRWLSELRGMVAAGTVPVSEATDEVRDILTGRDEPT